jgi:hypothetical protein
MKREQDEAYQESLRADRAKVRHSILVIRDKLQGF